MKAWNITIAFVVLIIVILAVAYFAQQKKKKREQEKGANIMAKFPAKRGDSGEHIGDIQRWLNTKLNPPMVQLDVDNKWGGITDTAMIFVTKKNTVTYAEYKEMV